MGEEQKLARTSISLLPDQLAWLRREGKVSQILQRLIAQEMEKRRGKSITIPRGVADNTLTRAKPCA